MSLEYIRKTYGVPAFRGRTISFQGCLGEIVGADCMYLKIKLDERPLEILRVHPTWMIDYYMIRAADNQLRGNDAKSR